MNVGGLRLNAVNSSQPQLVESPSQQSLAASNQSSSSDYASGTSTVQRNPAPHYETPPSRPHSPVSIKPAESEMTLPMRPSTIQPAPLNVRRNQAPPDRHSTTALYREIYDMSPPTPGIDESQYVRFAIEQLTRDEELLGRARQGSISSQEYPVERIVPDEGLGYYHAQAPGAGPASGSASTPPTSSQAPNQSEEPSTSPVDVEDRVIEDVFIPIDPPRQSQHPQLGYLPLCLRPIFLSFFAFLCLLIIGSLLFCNIWSLRQDGLYDYDGTGTSRYFVFQFMPQLLGLVVVFCIFVLQAAVYRIIPFAALSSQPGSERVLQDMSMRPANFFLPDLRPFRQGKAAVGICLMIFWLSYFTVPLLSCMFQTTLADVDDTIQWRWTTVQSVVWVLIVLYVFLVGAAILLGQQFRGSRSALMWDPVSLADLITLFQKSNIIPDLARSEISGSTRTRIPPKPLRLGYWTTSSRAGIFHTVGEENAPAQREEKGSGSCKEKTLSVYDSSFNLEYQRYSNAESFTRNIHSPFFRYRWAPWFLRDAAVVAWIITAVILYLIFLILSFVNQRVERGFLPQLPTVTNPQGFSSSNFLYSFLPSLFGMALLLAWQPIDAYFRAVQPFANMSCTSDGTTASRSLLSSYQSHWPIQISLLALLNKDYKVAYISFISVLSSTLPLLSGGIFTAQFFSQQQEPEVRIVATMPAYYALCVFLGVYAFSFLAIWPKRKRYLPHRLGTLADYLSFLYQSSLLTDPVFEEGIKSKRGLVGRLVADESKRYFFGIYVGRDGKEHLGIDRVGSGSGNGSGKSNGNGSGSGSGSGSRGSNGRRIGVAV